MQPEANDTEPTKTSERAVASSQRRVDYDQPYQFGHTPRSSSTFPFSTREYARLLLLRSRVHAGLVAADDLRTAA